MKIAGMVVWALTAGIGVYLLAAGLAAERRLIGAAQPVGRGQGLSSGPPAPERADGATVVGVAALASGAVTVASAAASDATARGAAAGGAGGDSALLEFIHPALALTGLTFWIFFVVTNGRWFAWIACGIVVAAIIAGLSWAFSGWRKPDARDQPRSGSTALPQGTANPHVGGGFPGHLVLAHGLAAACTLALVVISALAATAHP